MSADFHSKTSQRAAKEYRCDECRSLIPVGTPYVRSFGKSDGDTYEYKTCVLCDDLWHAAWDFCDWWGPEDTAPMGELRQYLREEYGIEDAAAWLTTWKAAKAVERARMEAPPWLPDDLAASLASHCGDGR